MTINPHRITVALDRAKLFGPTADGKVGAVEPDLDNWEAGISQPTEQQLAKLAALPAPVRRAPLRRPAVGEHEKRHASSETA
jgi:hypothetical protein